MDAFASLGVRCRPVGGRGVHLVPAQQKYRACYRLCSARHLAILWQNPYHRTMRHSLNAWITTASLLAALPAVVAAPPEGSGPGSPRADGVVPQAGLLPGEATTTADAGLRPSSVVSLSAAQVAREPALAADIRCRVSAFDQQLAGAGHYVQVASPSGLLVRLELRIGLGEHVVSWLEVRGPQSYWLRRHIPPDPPVLGRVDLRQVRRQAYEEPAEGSELLPSTSWILWGGIPRLLGALEEHFEFDQLRADELRFQPAPGASVARLPVLIVRGRWKAGVREQLAGNQGKKASKIQNMPQLPEEVELVLGRQDTPFPLFPYRITFWQRRARRANEEGGATWQELVTVEFFHVSRQVPADPSLFDYAPGDQEVENWTPAYVQRLRAGDTRR
jgi:hypothetical protein